MTDDTSNDEPLEASTGEKAETSVSSGSGDDTAQPTGDTGDGAHDATAGEETDATQSTPGGTGTGTGDSPPDPGEDFDARAAGKQEALEAKEHVPGEDEAEKTENAYRDKHQSLQRFQEDRRENQQNIANAQERVSNIETTIERLEAFPDDREFFEDVGQGVILPRKPDEHGGVLDRLNADLEAAERQVENLQRRAKSVERGVLINRFAMKWLENHYEDLSSRGRTGRRVSDR